jgi:hypothetical protein
MATTRSPGYVVTAAVWNALHAGLSDAGVFTGTITTSGTTTLSGPVSITGALSVASASASVFTAPASNAIAARLVGRSADNIAILDFTNHAQSTQQATIRADPNGMTFNTGSTARPYTFSDARVNSAAAQPAVIAYLSADQTGVIGGTDITFDTEVVDQANNFASSTFTAPVAGGYLIGGCVTIHNASGADATFGQSIDLSAVVNGATFYTLSGIPTPLVNGKRVRLPISGYLQLAASDTVKIRLTAGGGEILTAIGTGSPTRSTWVSIRLLI